mgnify:CR=1 FL=1
MGGEFPPREFQQSLRKKIFLYFATLIQLFFHRLGISLQLMKGIAELMLGRFPVADGLVDLPEHTLESHDDLAELIGGTGDQHHGGSAS